MNKIFVTTLAFLSIFMLLTIIISGSYVAFIFLPIPVYFIAEIFTNSEDFDIKNHKRAVLFYVSLLFILILATIYKIT